MELVSGGWSSSVKSFANVLACYTVTSDLACSATAFLVWDVLINLDKEVHAL